MLLLKTKLNIKNIFKKNNYIQGRVNLIISMKKITLFKTIIAKITF